MTRRLWLVVVLLVLAVGKVDAEAARKMASWRELPYGACRFVYDQFGATPDPWQEQLLVAFADPKIQRISLQACAGPGKTCGEAWCGWYFLATQVSREGRGFEHPNGLATSITGDNLRDNLWKELAKWQARSELLRTEFAWTSSRIFHKGDEATWFLAARSWPKSGSADEQGRTFSGLHGKNVLVLVDESGSIPPTILRAAEQALPNTHFGKVLQAGNPISHEGMLYEAQLKAHLWHIIRVTGDPDDPNAWVNNARVAAVEPGQQTPADWAREQIKTYGKHNPWVMAYILGQFPPQSINALLSMEQVQLAIDRVVLPGSFEHQQRRIGVDVARFGDDRTVLFPRQGLQSFDPVELRGADTNQIVARVMLARDRWDADLILIDDSFSWGNGVIDNLRNAGATPHGVDFGGPAIDALYENRRAEMWIRMSDAIKGAAGLPDGKFTEQLKGELVAPTYTFSKNGRFLLEAKDQVKKRLGRSPDLADALAITYALPEMPRHAHRLPGSRATAEGRASTDYDPISGRASTDYDPNGRG